MAELILVSDDLNTGRQAINNWYSGNTNLWSAGTAGSFSLRTVNGGSTSTGNFSLSIGKANQSTNTYSSILGGSGNTATGIFSLVENGKGNNATSTYSTVVNGNLNAANGTRSFVINGASNTASNTYSFVLNGSNNKATALRSFIGNGSTNKAYAVYSTILNGGNNRVSSGANLSSILGGSINLISAGAVNCIVTGGLNTISGSYSVIMGGISNTISSSHGLTWGFRNTSSHNYGIAFGKDASTDATYQMVFAKSAGNNTVKIDYFNGQLYLDGNGSFTPADYAEYFEWADGNINDDKRYGYAVSLNNGKIEINNSNIIGIISSVPGIIGDSHEFHWKDKYITDEWGVRETETYRSFLSEEHHCRLFIDNDNNIYSDKPHNAAQKEKFKIEFTIPENTTLEEVKIEKFSPLYKGEEYTPRSKRKEWAVVGLLGKLRIRTTEKITSKFVDISENGMAKNGTKYPVLSTLKEFDGNYGITMIFFK